MSRANAIFQHLLRRYATLDQNLKIVLRGSLVVFGLRVLGAGLGFAFNVVIARLLGAKEAGVYYLALAITSVGILIGRLGLDSVLLRFGASYASQHNWAIVRAIVNRGLFIALITSSCVTILLLAVAPWIATVFFHKPGLSDPLRLMAISIIPSALLLLIGESLKAIERPGQAAFVQSASVPLFGLIIISCVGDAWGVNGASIAYTGAAALTLITGVALYERNLPTPRTHRALFDMGLLVTTSLPLFWVALMDLIMNTTDTVLLGIWADSTALGIYGAARRTALITTFILVAVNGIAAPRFAVLFANGDRIALARLARGAAFLTTLLTTPILLLFVLWPSGVLHLFGQDFADGATALMILAAGQFVNAATGPVGYLLVMTGHETSLRNNDLLAAILNVVLNLWLIPAYGINGAAIATSVSLASRNLGATVLAFRKLSILTLPIPLLRARDRSAP